MKRTGPTNSHVQELIAELERVSATQDAPVWSRVAHDLALPRRQHVVVNLASLTRVVKDGETIVVPGKVLGTGALDHKVTIAALGFSKGASDRIHEAHGKCLTIAEMVKQNPKGTNVRLLG